MKFNHNAIPIMLIILFAYACVDEPYVPVEEPSAKVINHTGCKNNDVSEANSAVEEDAAYRQECIHYDYDGAGTLSITHENVALNCCANDFSIRALFEDETIAVTEISDDNSCNCICLYNIDFEIEHLNPGTYTFSVVSMETELDLTTAGSGSYCEDRTGDVLYKVWDSF